MLSIFHWLSLHSRWMESSLFQGTSDEPKEANDVDYEKYLNSLKRSVSMLVEWKSLTSNARVRSTSSIRLTLGRYLTVDTLNKKNIKHTMSLNVSSECLYNKIRKVSLVRCTIVFSLFFFTIKLGFVGKNESNMYATASTSTVYCEEFSNQFIQSSIELLRSIISTKSNLKPAQWIS